MQNNKNQDKKNIKAKVLALVLAGLMVFSVVAGVLVYFIG